MVPPAAGTAGSGGQGQAGAGATVAGAGDAGRASMDAGVTAGSSWAVGGMGGVDAGPIVCRIPDTLPVTDEDADGGVDPKCIDVPRTIFAENCIGGFCHHARPGQARMLDLMSPCVADRLIGKLSTCEGLLLIDPSKPDQSFLLDKLQNEMPTCGASMPDGWHLPPEQVACVTAWVNAVLRASTSN
jgi:hypothetical protein